MAAEAAFYAAFQSADTEAMMLVWAHDESDDLVCIHPHGPRLVGFKQIRESWQQILTRSPPIRLEISRRRVVANETLAVHYVAEHIHVGNDDNPSFTILATNVYRRTAAGWRMILHHASPTPDSREQAGVEGVDESDAGDIILH